MASLETGVGLTDAVAAVDDHGEFRWRLRNATHAKSGFPGAGRLDCVVGCRAFQQEQTAAQLISTGLVLFNGVVVGALAITVFRLLLSIIDSASLW